jgi:hypothetical protein
VFLSVIAFRFSLGHPPTFDDSIPLESRDIWLGWIALALFALCFTPALFAFS